VQPASTTTAQRSRPRLALQHRRMREAYNIAHLEHNNSCTAGETDMTDEGHKTSRTAALHTCSIIGAGATASSLAVPSRCILTNCQAAQARQQVLETKQPHPACHCELLVQWRCWTVQVSLLFGVSAGPCTRLSTTSVLAMRVLNVVSSSAAHRLQLPPSRWAVGWCPSSSVIAESG
jgi:hypothetical protein